MKVKDLIDEVTSPYFTDIKLSLKNSEAKKIFKKYYEVARKEGVSGEYLKEFSSKKTLDTLIELTKKDNQISEKFVGFSLLFIKEGLFKEYVDKIIEIKDKDTKTLEYFIRYASYAVNKGRMVFDKNKELFSPFLDTLIEFIYKYDSYLFVHEFIKTSIEAIKNNRFEEYRNIVFKLLDDLSRIKNQVEEYNNIKYNIGGFIRLTSKILKENNIEIFDKYKRIFIDLYEKDKEISKIFNYSVDLAIKEKVIDKLFSQKNLDILLELFNICSIYVNLENSIEFMKIDKLEEYKSFVLDLLRKSKDNWDFLDFLMKVRDILELEKEIKDNNYKNKILELAKDGEYSAIYNSANALSYVSRLIGFMESTIEDKRSIYREFISKYLEIFKKYRGFEELFTDNVSKILRYDGKKFKEYTNIVLDLLDKNQVLAEIFMRNVDLLMEEKTLDYYLSQEFLDTLLKISKKDLGVSYGFAKTSIEFMKIDKFKEYKNIVLDLLDKNIESARAFIDNATDAIKNGVLNYYLSQEFLDTLLKISKNNFYDNIIDYFIKTSIEFMKIDKSREYFEKYKNTVLNLLGSNVDTYKINAFIISSIPALENNILEELIELTNAGIDHHIFKLIIYGKEDVIKYIKNTKDDLNTKIEKLRLKYTIDYELERYFDLKDGPIDYNKLFDDLEKITGLLLSKYTIKESLNLTFSLKYAKDEGARKMLINASKILYNYWNDENINKILSIMKEEGINIETLKDRILKIWNNNGEEINASYEDTVKALFYSLVGSKDPKNIEWGNSYLEKIVGKEKLKSAKGFYQSLQKEIKYSTKQLVELLKNGNYDEIIKRLFEIGSKYNGDNKKGLESFMDILTTVSSIKDGRSVGGKYIVAFTGRFPSVMFSWESTGSCSHLPAIDDNNPEFLNGLGSVKYILDPRVVYIGIASIDKADINSIREKGKIDGIIIGYLSKDLEGKKYWLIDSVEMGTKIFFPYGDKWFNKNWEKVYELIIDYGKKLNVDYVLFNKTTFNTVPVYFLSKLTDEYRFSKSEVELNIIGPKEIPYDEYSYGKHYLEAFGGWNIPERKVKGYIVPITIQGENKYAKVKNYK